MTDADVHLDLKIKNTLRRITITIIRTERTIIMTGIRKGVADTDIHDQGHLSLKIRKMGRRVTTTIVIKVSSGTIVLIIHDHEVIVSRYFLL